MALATLTIKVDTTDLRIAVRDAELSILRMLLRRVELDRDAALANLDVERAHSAACEAQIAEIRVALSRWDAGATGKRECLDSIDRAFA